MANIKLTELSELLSVDNANTILYAADLSVSPNVSHYIKVGTIGTLTDYSIANAAFLQANTAFSVGYNANVALNISQQSFSKANTAHNQANVATSTSTSAFNSANSGTVLAQAAFNQANSAHIRANSAYNFANTIPVSLIQASFNRANNSVIRTGDDVTGIITTPTAANGTSNNMIATTQFVQSSISSRVPAIPPGVILMWSGAIYNIPSGWVLCDGTNGTPDLRNRFIIGAANDVGGDARTTVTGTGTKLGGSKDSVVVSHSHTAISSVSDPGHVHNIPVWYSTDTTNIAALGSGRSAPFTSTQTNSAQSGISVSTTINSTGTNGTNANLPPYYSLAFIMKI